MCIGGKYRAGKSDGRESRHFYLKNCCKTMYTDVK
jgi:hypothetical protein